MIYIYYISSYTIGNRILVINQSVIIKRTQASCPDRINFISSPY